MGKFYLMQNSYDLVLLRETWQSQYTKILQMVFFLLLMQKQNKGLEQSINSKMVMF
jgi:hypothetical protein